MINIPVTRIEAFPLSLKNKIYVRKDNVDDTLWMTAAILLFNRVDNLKIECTQGKFSDTDISTNPEIYTFHWFIDSSGNPDELLKQKNIKNFERLPTHEKFISDQLKQQVYIRLLPKENTVCVFTGNITYPAWHGIQFFIPKFFRIFKEKPLSKEEISFLETLTYKTKDNYISKLTDLSNSESFRSYLFKDQLEAFEKKLYEKKVAAAQNTLNTIESTMNKALEEYRKACEQRLEAIALVSGLKTMADQVEEHTELQNYLINNPRISNLSINGSKLSFIIKTFLAPHHIDEWEILSKREEIFSEYVCYNFPDKKDIKLLLDAIFSENRCLKLKMCAYITMDYFGSEVQSSKKYDFGRINKDLVNYIPNPHLHYHNCFGQNDAAILDQLALGDVVGAIECAIACAQRINIHEGFSFRPFVKDMLSSKGKCLVNSDGIEMTVKEAITYLKGLNNA